MNISKKLCLIALTFIFNSIAFANSGVSYSHTRLIYNEGVKAISIKIKNHGDKPYLIQSGISNTTDLKSDSSFIITPPLFRLEGEKNNTIRIVKLNKDLAKDRESIFYFHSTAIPSQEKKLNDEQDDRVGAQLSIAMRTVLKVFYRPVGLSPAIEKTYDSLEIKQIGNKLKINNPSPYYQSFAQLEFDGKAVDLNIEPSMIPPMSEITYSTDKKIKIVRWSIVTDFGSTTDFFIKNI